MKKKWLIVSFVGNTDYREVEYRFKNGNKVLERFFGVALTKDKLQFSEIETGSVLFICTDESYDMHSNELKSKMQDLNFNEEQYDFLIFSETDMKNLFSQLFDHLKTKNFGTLYLDITNTFRDIPFLLYPELLFFKERFGIDMEIEYARGNIRKDGYFKAEQVNASTEIIEWLFATRMFIKKGDGTDFAKLLNKRFEYLKTGASKNDFRIIGNIQQLSKLFSEFTATFNAIDPYEVGRQAYRILETKKKIDEYDIYEQFNFPWVIKSMLNQISDSLTDIKLSFRNKQKIVLDEVEIKRQQKLLKWYIDIGDFNSAMIFVREFIINCYLFAHDVENFLVLAEREKMTKKVNEKFYNVEKVDVDTLNEFEIIWNKISSIRNYFSHCGNRQEDFPRNFPKNYLELFERLTEISCKEIKEILSN